MLEAGLLCRIIQQSGSNSHYVIASALCEAISSPKQGIASMEERHLAMTWFILRIADRVVLSLTVAYPDGTMKPQAIS
jgi:hypothetical protein